MLFADSQYFLAVNKMQSMLVFCCIVIYLTHPSTANFHGN